MYLGSLRVGVQATRRGAGPVSRSEKMVTFEKMGKIEGDPPKVEELDQGQ